jgi:HAMP domain-containing protein
LSGKLLWIQEKTADVSFQLRQVPTASNVADIGTKRLSRQRLFYLLYECGLAYIIDFTSVGADEFVVQNEKMVNSKQLKQITKANLRMSIAVCIAGGLEPARLGAVTQQCEVSTKEPKHDSWWMFTLVVLGICVLTLFSKLALRTWRWLEQRLDSLETTVRGIGSDLEQVQMQLGDHYGFAAELSNQIDDYNGRTSTLEENHEILAARQAAFEQEMLEGFNTAERATNCVRYGLTEMGGFTRYASVTTDQLRHMMTQKRGNFVIWNVGNRTENTDPIEEAAGNLAQTEEETPTSDPETDGNEGTNGQSGLERLLQNMRADQNVALASERWHEASEIQHAIVAALDVQPHQKD